MNKNIKGHFSKVILVGLLGISYNCFGVTVACDVSNSLSATGHTNTVAGIPIARAPGAADDFNTLSTTDTGCASGNIAFSNFIFTSGGTAASTYISTLANQTFGAAGVTAVFSAIRGSDSVNTDGNANDDRNNWNAGNGATTTIADSYTFSTSSTTKVSVFTLALLGESLGSGGFLGNDGTITGTVFLCLGGSFTTSSSGSCGGTLQATHITLGAGTTYQLALTTPQFTIGVLNDFVLAGGTGFGGGTTFLTAFDESFGTPEPSTFGLFGAALAGLGFLRYRSLKKRNS